MTVGYFITEFSRVKWREASGASPHLRLVAKKGDDQRNERSDRDEASSDVGKRGDRCGSGVLFLDYARCGLEKKVGGSGTGSSRGKQRRRKPKQVLQER